MHEVFILLSPPGGSDGDDAFAPRQLFNPQQIQRGERQVEVEAQGLLIPRLTVVQSHLLLPFTKQKFYLEPTSVDPDDLKGIHLYICAEQQHILPSDRLTKHAHPYRPLQAVMPAHHAVQLHTLFDHPHPPPPGQVIVDDLPVVPLRTTTAAVGTAVQAPHRRILPKPAHHRISGFSNGIDKFLLCICAIEDPGVGPLADDLTLGLVLSGSSIEPAAFLGLGLDLLNLEGVGEVVSVIDETDQRDFESSARFSIAGVVEEAQSVGLLSRLPDEGLIHDGDQLVLVDAGFDERLVVEGGEVEVSVGPSVLAAGAWRTVPGEVGAIGAAGEREEGGEHRQHEFQLGLGKSGKASENLFDESHLSSGGRGVGCYSHLSPGLFSIHDCDALKTDRTIVNYDLPWNPNRLEQRFGRIHRIGQREVCHLWNLIAKDTREGDVYVRLLEKLEVEREALGGKVYDVLGRLFDQTALRKLLMEAIQYGDNPATKARLDKVVEGVVNRDHLRKVLAERALVHDSMNTSRIQAIREDMERAQARRLQPHFIQAFFLDAFTRLGGKVYRREEGRWEVKHVPGVLRERDRHIGLGAPVLKRYERICFEKDKVDQHPRAELVCPGSPLLSATIDLTLERHGALLKRGAVLVDESDLHEVPRLLFYLEHAVQGGRRARTGESQTISKRMHFVEVGADGRYQDAGAAPYLDYRPATAEERASLSAELDADWLKRSWDDEVTGYAVAHVVPGHVAQVRAQRLEHTDKIEREVKARLTKEISYWDRRAQDLKEKERAGKRTRLPAQVAQERADDLAARLQSRLRELQQERHIIPAPPRVT